MAGDLERIVMSNVSTTYKGKKGYYTLRFSEDQTYPVGTFKSIVDAKRFAYEFHFGKAFKVVFVPDNWIFSERRYARPGE
jgi:hypothetical protein